MTHDLDQLLRERLEEYAAPVVADEHWRAGVVSRLEPVRIRHRRIRFAQVSVAAAAAIVAAVAVVVSFTGDDNARQTLPADLPPHQGSVEDVEWGYSYLSDPVTFDDMARNLRDAGLGEWVEPLHEKWGDFDGQIVMAWDENGEFSASIPGTPVSHTPSAWIARESLCFYGSDVCFGPSATELDSGGQRLTLTMSESESASIDGIPGEVYERALYTTVPFNEIPSIAPPELSPGTYQSAVQVEFIADSLRAAGLGSSVGPLQQKWGKADGKVLIRLELDGQMATVSVPGTRNTITGRYTMDGSLIRVEDADPQNDNGWIELAAMASSAEPGAFFCYKLWDSGPAAWDGLPAEVVAQAYFLTHFTPTEE